MENNSIQMVASAGHAVAYMIGPILNKETPEKKLFIHFH